MDIRNLVGRQVRRLRIGAGRSQQALCTQCGIYRTYLSRIESGTANPTIAVMAALAAALGVDIAELFKERFFINFTGIFPLLRDNPVIQYFWFEHERYRAV